MIEIESRLHEDVLTVVHSFIPYIDRFNIARTQYTNKFLEEGLKKKTVKQLTLIYDKIMEYEYNEFYDIKCLFYTSRLENIKYKYKNSEILSFKMYDFEYLSKSDKIDVIVSFFQRGDDVINLEVVNCILKGSTIRVEGNFNGESRYLQQRSLNIQVQAIFSEKMFKIFTLLVSILKNPKKKREKKTVIS